jgi:hypothetical protein
LTVANEKTTAPPTKPALSLAAMFGQVPDQDDYVTEVAGLPPSHTPVQRAVARRPAADLSGLAKLWELIGPGGVGKTLLGRWLGGKLLERGQHDQTLLAALDPGNRTLAAFFDNVMQPPSADPVATTAWLREVLKFSAKHRANGILDFGGGDQSKIRLLELAASIADTMEQDGVALVATYVMSPRVDDIAALKTFETMGFRPKATALILNLGRAESPAAFDAIRQQPAYKNALDRGAVEIWLPKLEPEGLALEIERRRLHFHDARDGAVQAGQKPSSISLLERVIIREWLERMDAEFAAVRTWLPWS